MIDYEMTDYEKIREIIARHDRTLLKYFNSSNMGVSAKTKVPELRFRTTNTGYNWKCTLVGEGTLHVTISKGLNCEFVIWK